MIADLLRDYLYLRPRSQRQTLSLVSLLVGCLLLVGAVLAQLAAPRALGTEALQIIAAVWLGAPLVGLAVADLKRGEVLLRELVVLAVLGAFVSGDPVLAGFIALITLLTLVVESWMVQLARQGIEGLAALAPAEAVRVADGQERTVPVETLVQGDLVRVYPGQATPLRGEVVSGHSRVEARLIDGEGAPWAVGPGDPVPGGSRNLDAVLEVRVQAAGSQSLLASAGRALRAVDLGALPLIRTFNRYAMWYTPIVLFVAAIALTLGPEDPAAKWQRAVAMLIVACPAAMLTAVPTAMMAALGAAARMGVIVQDLSALERARHLSAAVFDSTGRYRPGRLRLAWVRTAPEVEEDAVLRVVAAAQRHQDHPAARAVVEAARARGLALPEAVDLHPLAEQGLRATVAGKLLLVGTPDWLHAQLASVLTPEAQAAFDEARTLHRRAGLAVQMVIHGGSLLGWIVLREDAEQAAQAVRELRRRGVSHVALVARENQAAGERAAQGLEAAFTMQFEVKDKLDAVADLEVRNHRVAVIGDGVSDTSSRPGAALSVAMNADDGGAGVALSDVAVLGDDLERLPLLIELSRRVNLVLRQNFICGGLVITLMMALASLGLIDPVAGAILNGLGSILVMFNAARVGGLTSRQLRRDLAVREETAPLQSVDRGPQPGA